MQAELGEGSRALKLKCISDLTHSLGPLGRGRAHRPKERDKQASVLLSPAFHYGVSSVIAGFWPEHLKNRIRALPWVVRITRNG